MPFDPTSATIDAGPAESAAPAAGFDPASAKPAFRFSDYALRQHQGRSNVDVVYMTPDQYLSLTPPLEKSPKTDRQGKLLKRSLDKGEEIEEVPSLVMGDKGKVIDQDGRHRAVYAKEAGLERIPVAVKRYGKDRVPEIEGMTGTKIPWDFQPVEMPKADPNIFVRTGIATPDSPVGRAGSVREYVRGTALRAGDALEEGVNAAGQRIAHPIDSITTDMAQAGDAMQSPEGMRRFALAAGTSFGPAPPGGVPVGPRTIGGPGANVASTVPTPAEQLQARAVSKVASKMAQDAEAGGPTAEQALKRVQDARAAGKPLALIDAAGENTQAYGGYLARQPGPARNALRQFMEERDKGAGERLTADVRQGISDQGSAYSTQAALSEARSKVAGPKFRDFFETTVVAPQDAAKVERFIKDPIGQDAMQKGLRVIQLEKLKSGEPFNPKDYGVVKGEDGRFTLDTGIPNTRLMHAVKMGYDEIVEGFRDKTSGKLVLDQYGRAVNDVRAEYVKQLRGAFPEYADALDAWAGPSASKDAINAGRKILASNPEQIADRMKAMSPSDREFFKLGAADTLIERLAKKGPAADEAKLIIGNSWTQSQLRPLFETEEAYNRFIARVQDEADMFKTRNKLVGNSLSAERLVEDSSNKLEDMATVAKTVSKGPVHATLATLGEMARRMVANPKLNAEMTRILFSPDLVDTPIANKLLEGFSARASKNTLADPLILWNKGP